MSLHSQSILERRYREQVNILQDLLSWVSETEHAMGSAQPQSELVQPLSEQLNKMKVIITDENLYCVRSVIVDPSRIFFRENPTSFTTQTYSL